MRKHWRIGRKDGKGRRGKEGRGVEWMWESRKGWENEKNKEKDRKEMQPVLNYEDTKTYEVKTRME